MKKKKNRKKIITFKGENLYAMVVFVRDDESVPKHKNIILCEVLPVRFNGSLDESLLLIEDLVSFFFESICYC